MQLTIVSAVDDRIFNIEVDAAESVDTLKAILEAESGIPAAQQHLLNGSAPLAPGATLQAAGVADGAMLMLLPAQAGGGGAGGGGAGAAAARPQQQQQQQQRSDPAVELNADGTAKAPAAFIQAVKSNAAQLAALAQANPLLARAVREEDVEALQRELKSLRQRQLEAAEAQRMEDELADADPFDADAQRRIAELIRQRAVEENFALALEHSPEVFGTVHMLYVVMEVNPKANPVPVKAFVDSGAQMTIMTAEFAEKCGLAHLIDSRFQGTALGVGSTPIIGRIHAAPMRVAGHHVSTSITVLAQKTGPQFILGLDNLKRHQCCIDLARGVLRFGSVGADLEFLPEHEIPKDFRAELDEVAEEASKAGAATSGAANAGAATAAPPAAAAAPAPSTAAAPAPAPVAAPRPAAAGPTSAAPNNGAAALDAAVTKLQELGFPREAALQALQAAGGNVDMAASMLFGGM